jgi:hypothetical protein
VVRQENNEKNILQFHRNAKILHGSVVEEGKDEDREEFTKHDNKTRSASFPNKITNVL